MYITNYLVACRGRLAQPRAVRTLACSLVWSESPFTILNEEGQALQTSKALIPGHQLYQIPDCEDGLVIYLQPDLDMARVHRSIVLQPLPSYTELWQELDHNYKHLLQETISIESLSIALEERLIRKWEGLDERVQQVLILMQDKSHLWMSVTEIAEHCALSLSRLQHLFHQEMNLSISLYLRWQRLREAVRLFTLGNSLTEAAYEAGFTDSAHLSRVFSQTFGSPPLRTLKLDEM